MQVFGSEDFLWQTQKARYLLCKKVNANWASYFSRELYTATTAALGQVITET